MLWIAHRFARETAERVENSGREPYAMDPMDPVSGVGAGKAEHRHRRKLDRRLAVCGNCNFLLRMLSFVFNLHNQSTLKRAL